MALFALPGCIIISDGYGGFSARTWQEAPEEIRIEQAGVTALEVRGQNGKVDYQAEDDGAQVVVHARKRGGGMTSDSAAEALAAIDVYVEDRGAGVQRIGWRWREDRHRSWQGRVDFTITGPSNLSLDVETRNGEITLAGVADKVRAVTYNGGVNVASSNGALYAESYNGGISVNYAGDDVTLSTHNGGINARLTGSGPVGGTITTQNGAVEVAIADNLATQLRCTAQNGEIKLDVPNQSTSVSSRVIKATLGEGGPPLSISTQNGGVRIRPARS